MLANIRRRATYANVVATLALIMAVGGGSAYALQGRNTVFSDDIAPNEAKASDVKEGSLKIPRLQFSDTSGESTGAGQDLAAFAYCPPGYSVTGGGFLKSDPDIQIRFSFPYTDQLNYDIRRVDGFSTGAGQSVTARAVCQRGTTLDGPLPGR